MNPLHDFKTFVASLAVMAIGLAALGTCKLIGDFFGVKKVSGTVSGMNRKRGRETARRRKRKRLPSLESTVPKFVRKRYRIGS